MMKSKCVTYKVSNDDLWLMWTKMRLLEPGLWANYLGFKWFHMNSSSNKSFVLRVMNYMFILCFFFFLFLFLFDYTISRNSLVKIFMNRMRAWYDILSTYNKFLPRNFTDLGFLKVVGTFRASHLLTLKLLSFQSDLSIPTSHNR